MEDDEKKFYIEGWKNYGKKTSETIQCSKFLADEDEEDYYLTSVICEKYNYIDCFMVNKFFIRIFEKRDVEGQIPEFIISLHPTCHIFFYCKGLRESLECIDYLAELAKKIELYDS